MIKKNPFFFAFLFPAITDGITTILGQNTVYWSSQKIVNEASPAYYFLLASPWVFILGSIVWFSFWYCLLKKLKEPFNLFLMFLFIAGHSWGSGGWIMKIFKQSGVYTTDNQLSIMFAWSMLILYFILVAAIATHCLRLHVRTNKNE